MMTRPVVATVMTNAGWTREEFDRRDAMIMEAAMQVYPTRASWHNKVGDSVKSQELETALQPVAARFEEFGRNGWYVPSGSDIRNGRDFSQGLLCALVRWARGQMSYRTSHFSGWFYPDGTKSDIAPAQSLVLKLRTGSQDSDMRTDATPSGYACSNGTRSSSSPLSTPPASDDEDRIGPPVSDYVSHKELTMSLISTGTPSELQGAAAPGLNIPKTLGNQNSEPAATVASLKEPAAALVPLEHHASNNDVVMIDWSEITIEIDASSIGKDTLWILMCHLIPQEYTTPWKDFDYEHFFNELTEVTDTHKLQRGEHDLIFMDGMRRHPIRNKHDYGVMLRKFAESYPASGDTIKFMLENRLNDDVIPIKVEPVILNMEAFRRPHVSVSNAQRQKVESARIHDHSTSHSNSMEDRPFSDTDPPALPLRSDIPELHTNRRSTLEVPRISKAETTRSLQTRRRRPTEKQRALDEAKRAEDSETDGSQGRLAKRRARKTVRQTV